MPASLPRSPAASSLSSPSSRRHKVRSPAHRADRDRLSHASSSGKSASSPPSLPATIRYLEQLRFRMISSRPTPASKHVQYVLLVQRKRDELPWTVTRSFADYRALKKRLLGAMELGHFCNAECPWMYSFVKSHFPKDARFFASAKFVVRKRVEALTEWFATIHAHLLSRANHCCSILTTAVALELIQFLVADLPADSDASWTHFVNAAGAHTSAASGSRRTAALPPLEISVRLATDLSNATTLTKRIEPQQHDGLLHVLPPQSTLTTLSCGHAFHDECIVPRLNASMRCPTCGHAQAFC